MVLFAYNLGQGKLIFFVYNLRRREYFKKKKKKQYWVAIKRDIVMSHE